MYKQINIGEEIQKEMENQNIGATVMAKKIDTNRRRIYRILEKNSIDTDLLFKVSKVLKHDFFKLYSDKLSENEPLSVTKTSL